MQRPRSFASATLIGLAILASACDRQSEPLSPPDEAPAPQFQQVPAGPNPDQHALGVAIPAFGGLFLDNGTPTVYLTDPSARPAVERALAGFLASRGVQAAQMQVRQARFSYSELESAFNTARPPIFDGPGTVFADLDEARNQVVIGVENGAAQARVNGALAGLGLPEGAVAVELSQPILPVATTLRDRFDPVPGGVQIHFGQYLCSIGVIAQLGGQLGFVTASHCTDHQGGVDGTVYYQPLSSTDGTVVGVETVDPDYYTRRQGPCPYTGAKCRRSDAAFVASTGARPFKLGSIAATTSLGSIDWTGGYIDLSGEAKGNGLVGEVRDKVGRTTGHTQGTVSASCVDTGVSGSNIVLLCQDWVSSPNTVIVGAGDSGSQIFEGTTWWGQLWGGSSDGTTLVYSPATNVQAELGSLTVTSGSSGGGPVGSSLTASFTYSCHFGDCTFDGSGSTGATSYAWTFGDGGQDSGPVVSHPYTTTGVYDVTLTVTGANDATDMATNTVTCSPRGNKLQCK